MQITIELNFNQGIFIKLLERYYIWIFKYDIVNIQIIKNSFIN